MRIEFDRNACDAWFQCVQEWDAFEMNVVEGKADLVGGEDSGDGVVVREVPEDAEEQALAAARACPIDAIAASEGGETLDVDG